LDLVNPRTYLSVAAFQAQPSDYDLSSYSANNLQDLLVRASGVVDAYLRRTLLATQVTERMRGDGTNTLFIGRHPIIFVKRIEFVLPGMQGFQLPVSQILVDYNTGENLNYTPLVFQGMGLTVAFPRGAPFDITYGYGMGYAVPAPAFTTQDVTPQAGTPLAPGTYYIAVTSQTMWGESTSSITQITTATGSINVVITPVPGAYIYPVYLGTSNSASALNLVGRSPSTNYGSNPLTVNVQSLSAPTGIFPQTLPTTDSSAYPLPNAIIEATRLIALGILWEQNNLANRGIYRQSSDHKELMWRSTEGQGGKGVSYVQQQAMELLKPYSLQSVF